jgi:hypothetical protein
MQMRLQYGLQARNPTKNFLTSRRPRSRLMLQMRKLPIIGAESEKQRGALCQNKNADRLGGAGLVSAQAGI